MDRMLRVLPAYGFSPMWSGPDTRGFCFDYCDLHVPRPFSYLPHRFLYVELNFVYSH